MVLPAFERSGIAIYKDEPQADPYILRPWQTFLLPEHGVYTLEGPNQIGKSVLIKLLMGVHPPSVAQSRDNATRIDEAEYQINSVADAHRAGLVAVFQDDQLIPTMTVREQLVMRHGIPAWKYFLCLMWNGIYGKTVAKWASGIGGAPTSGWLRKLKPNDDLLFPSRKVESCAKRLLGLYGEKYIANMDKYPRELSGGGKAVARLVSAQLTRGIKVLFLDEALSGVERDVWPELVEALKRWRNESNASIVAVSHNPDELIRWQPIQRLVIEAQTLRARGPRGYAWLEPGLPNRIDAFPVFAPPYGEHWFEDFAGPFWLVVDAAVKEMDATKDIVAFLTRHGEAPPRVTAVDVSERGKNCSDRLICPLA